MDLARNILEGVNAIVGPTARLKLLVTTLTTLTVMAIVVAQILSLPEGQLISASVSVILLLFSVLS